MKEASLSIIQKQYFTPNPVSNLPTFLLILTQIFIPQGEEVFIS
jgi:hypothetical protein